MNVLSLKIKNYKCFGDVPQGFDGIKPINVLIGRNNSGKSSMLDLIEYVINPRDLDTLGHNGRKPEISLMIPLNEDELKGVFRQDTSSGPIDGNHWEFGKKLIGNNITISIEKSGKQKFLNLDPGKIPASFKDGLAQSIKSPFSQKVFKRIRAERDIKSEPDNNIVVDENGNGATTMIQQFINKANLPSDLVEKTILSELNKITEPDSSFRDIIVQQLDGGRWEIYLEEENKGRIALSHSGSGLKTILLVLIYLFLVPFKEKIPLEKYVFAIEEPENNLHPAAQRRLFLYLKEFALKHHVYFFITSHSNIAIDLFSNDSSAQIYHIESDNNKATSKPVKTYIEKAGILDDLDIRASDLLQSNGVIWVEGPSDRIYINKWIDIWSEGKLREGAHYQCVFYGGRLLSHFSAVATENEMKDLIKILLINRNAIFLIDSDKRSESDSINDTKQRIYKEIEGIGGICWITKGKEIENYIPKSAIASYYKIEVDENVGLYEPFNDYLEKIKLGEGDRFISKKVFFAEEIRSHLTKENLGTIFDLKEKMDELIIRIKKWNAI